MSFDALAPHYRWMELLLAGEKLQRCRVRFLNQLQAAKHILILGEGNGRFLLACRNANPNARITCVDNSARMLTAAQVRLQRNNQSLDRIEFVCADALNWIPPDRYDALVTHFFLDCFPAPELESLVAKLSAAAVPQASWLVADFQVPDAGMQQVRARLILRSMYLFFRFATALQARTLTPPDSFLKANGFQLRNRAVSEWGLLHTDWWQRSN